MLNTIFIEGCSYSDIKKALNQWIDLYADDFETIQKFELFNTGDVNHIIKADDKLPNNQFNYLVNYLKYPENIDYKINIKAYTKVSSPTPFPKERKGEEIMIFIPESDNEYDNVYWVGKDNNVWKTDFGGKTTHAKIQKKYEDPMQLNFQYLGTPEILVCKPEKKEKFQDKIESKTSIEKRFKTISIFLAIIALFGLLVFQTNTDLFFYSSFAFGFGSWLWFSVDYKMMRVNKFYNLSFLISAIVFVYGYYIQKKELAYSLIEEISIFTSLPLWLVIVQKPLRLFFKKIFGREPVIEKPAPSFGDFIYTILLLAIPLLLVMLVPFLNNRPKTMFGVPVKYEY